MDDPPQPPLPVSKDTDTALPTNSASAPALLSFDIGTRHLAYCALCPPQPPTRPTPTITHWQVVDLLAVTGSPYDASCTWVLAKSWKVSALRAYLDTHHLSSVGNRKTLVDRVHADLKARKVPKVAGTNLNMLATKLYAYLDTQPWMVQCRTVVLENQPCLTNPIMKSVQMLLYGYFLYKGVWCTYRERAHTTPTPTTLPRVMLTSATNKLKVCQEALRVLAESGDGSAPTGHAAGGTGGADEAEAPTGKAAYKQRKRAAIELAGKLLRQWHADTPDETTRRRLGEWRQLLDTSCVKEQDDLSDAFLQGLFVQRRDLAKPAPRKAKKARSAGAVK